MELLKTRKPIIEMPVSCIRPERFGQIEPVLDYIGQGVLLAGGSLRTVLDPRDTLSDFDFFFMNQESALSQEDELRFTGWKETFRCPENKLVSWKRHGLKLQQIRERTYGSMTELIESFDFTACMAATDGETFLFDRRWPEDVRKKRLSLNLLTYPIATMARTSKYIKKGYRASQDLYVDIFDAIRHGTYSPDHMRLYID